MSLELIIAVVFIVPIVAFVTAFIWYVNLGGAWSALKKVGRRSSATSRTSRLETEKA